MDCVFPQEIIDDIIDHFQDDLPPKNLQTCSLVAKSWVPRSRRSLFRDISFPGRNRFDQWCKAIPAGSDGIASYARVLRLSDPWGKLMDPDFLQGRLAHFTSFRSLQSLAFFLVDLSGFDRISITNCFRHFETVKSLVLCNVASPITNILLLTYLFPNLQRLDIEDLKPPKDMIVMDVPVEAEPFMVRALETAPTLRGSFRMAKIPVGASSSSLGSSNSPSTLKRSASRIAIGHQPIRSRGSSTRADQSYVCSRFTCPSVCPSLSTPQHTSFT